jgi:O-acetyl-ADP-ribose deacetylase (regulator of RNase III)
MTSALRQKTFGHTQVLLELLDLTKFDGDAIVNAANPSLAGGGGVDGAVHRAGGQAILRECQDIVSKRGRLEPGRAVVTTAGHLPARYVIHTVGPIWHHGRNREAEILTSAYRESLALADKLALRRIAFPSISTGAYGYPLEQAAETALAAVKAYLTQDTLLEQITFCLFSTETLEAYSRVLERM